MLKNLFDKEKNELDGDLKKIIKKTLNTDNKGCNSYEISLLSYNILAPELLNYFWTKSYKLEYKTITKQKLNEIIEKKNNNIENIILESSCDIVGLQEVSVPIKNVETYLQDSYSDKKYKYYLKSYESENLKIAGYSFKQNPMNYVSINQKTDYNKFIKKNKDIKKDKNNYYSIKNSKLKYVKSFDSGVLTLYNPNKLELLEVFNSEHFGLDKNKYLTLKLEKTKSKRPTLKKKLESSKRGVGSPFVFCKFKNKFNGQIFYTLNLHAIMNYPFVDSLKTVFKRINSLKKDVENFSWKNTIIFGDFNTEDYPKNNSIIYKSFKNNKQILNKKTKKKQPIYNYFNNKLFDVGFKENTNYNIIKSKNVMLKNSVKINIPLLKMKLNELKNENEKEKLIQLNNELIKSDYFTSDAKPVFCYFYIN